MPVYTSETMRRFVILSGRYFGFCAMFISNIVSYLNEGSDECAMSSNVVYNIEFLASDSELSAQTEELYISCGL